MMNDDDRRNDYVNDGLNGRTAQGQQTVYCQERPAIGVYHHNKMEFYEGTFAGSIFIAGRRMACYTPF